MSQMAIRDQNPTRFEYTKASSNMCENQADQSTRQVFRHFYQPQSESKTSFLPHVDPKAPYYCSLILPVPSYIRLN